MKNTILALTFLLGALTPAVAKEKDSLTLRENRIIVNFNAHQNGFYDLSEAFKYQIGFPSLEFQRRNGAKILSIELAKLAFEKSPTYYLNIAPQQLLYTDKFFQALGRVQLQRLLRSHDKKLQPFWGASFSPYYSKSYRDAAVSNFFQKEIVEFGLIHHFSLGTYYNFGRYFVQANALIGVGSIGVITQDSDDPSIPVANRRNSILDFNLQNRDHLFRIGIGMKL